jgi:hypothetical protein
MTRPSLTPLARHLLLPLALAVALGLVTYALTASNTVPVTKAGAGAGIISGYSVTNVRYGLNATDPRKIDSVAFDLDTAPPGGSTIRIKLESGGSAWYACTAAGAAMSCNTTTPQATAAAANELTVVVG